MSRRNWRTHVRPRMGTLLALTLPAGSHHGEMRHVETVFATATTWDRVMNPLQPQSDLNRLNRHAGRPRGIRSRALAHALRAARELARQTEGAFDPTIGPLLDVWRQAARRGVPPSVRALETAVARVDWRAIVANEPRVSLDCPGMAVDLGAFGKGIALDRIAARLRRQGCPSAVLNFGESSLVAVGQPCDAPWRVLLRDSPGGFAGEFELDDRACSTSATTGQGLRIGSRTFSHIIDPRTGRPVPALAQATVLAHSAARAEAISTALLVLGRNSVLKISQTLAVDVCWIDRCGVYTTPGFPLQRAGGAKAIQTRS